MMMSLADDDLVETKNTYQTKLRSISDGAALKCPKYSLTGMVIVKSM